MTSEKELNNLLVEFKKCDAELANISDSIDELWGKISDIIKSYSTNTSDTKTVPLRNHPAKHPLVPYNKKVDGEYQVKLTNIITNHSEVYPSAHVAGELNNISDYAISCAARKHSYIYDEIAVERLSNDYSSPTKRIKVTSSKGSKLFSTVLEASLYVGALYPDFSLAVKHHFGTFNGVYYEIEVVDVKDDKDNSKDEFVLPDI